MAEDDGLSRGECSYLEPDL